MRVMVAQIGYIVIIDAIIISKLFVQSITMMMQSLASFCKHMSYVTWQLLPNVANVWQQI